MRFTTPSLQSLFQRVIFAWLVSSPLLSSTARADDPPVVPLPAAVAKDFELFGPGVVGKALPAPPLTNIDPYLNLGPATWEYKVVSGGKAGEQVRNEHYKETTDATKDGTVVWQPT